MTSNKTIEPWGVYRPGAATLPFRTLIRLGLSRGKIARWVRQRWTSKVRYVDAERNGIRFRLSVSNNATDAKLLTNSKVYDEPEILALSKRNSNRQSVFLDIGANTGYYSLSLAKQGFDRVLAIEPNPPTLELLRFNVEANGFSNVEVVPVCVGNHGTVKLHSSGDLGSTSILPEAGSQSIEVPSLPLTEILAERAVTSITSMKIDVEGAECLALIPFFQEASQSMWPETIVMEDCHSDDWDTDLVKFLGQRGYSISARTRGNVILARREIRLAA